LDQLRADRDSRFWRGPEAPALQREYRELLKAWRCGGHWMGLGSTGTITLAEARDLAAQVRKLQASGADPIAHRRAERSKLRVEAAKSMSFDDCVTAYLDAHREGWKNPKHRQQWENTLKAYASPHFDVPAPRVDEAGIVPAADADRR